MIEAFYAYLLAQDEITRSLILSGIGMAADALILAMLLPLFLSYLETRKWKPIRARLALEVRVWVERKLSHHSQALSGENPGLSPPFEIPETRVPETVRLLSISMTPEFSRTIAGIVNYIALLDGKITTFRHLIDDLRIRPSVADTLYFPKHVESELRELITAVPYEALLDAERQRGTDAEPGKAAMVCHSHYWLVGTIAQRMRERLPVVAEGEDDPYERVRTVLDATATQAAEGAREMLRRKVAKPKGWFERLRPAPANQGAETA